MRLASSVASFDHSLSDGTGLCPPRPFHCLTDGQCREHNTARLLRDHDQCPLTLHGVGVGGVDVHVSHVEPLRSGTLRGRAGRFVFSSKPLIASMIHTRPRRKLWDNSDGGRSFPEFQERVCGVAGAAVVGRSWPPAAEDLPRSSREFTSGQPQTCQQHKQQQWRKGEKRQKEWRHRLPERVPNPCGTIPDAQARQSISSQLDYKPSPRA